MKNKPNNLCVNDSLNNGLVAHYEFENNTNDNSGNNNRIDMRSFEFKIITDTILNH